jgi:hypothetical protein
MKMPIDFCGRFGCVNFTRNIAEFQELALATIWHRKTHAQPSLPLINSPLAEIKCIYTKAPSSV